LSLVSVAPAAETRDKPFLEVWGTVEDQWPTVTFMEIGWFETEDELDGIQRAFVTVLRAHAESWPLNPAETYLVLPGDEYYGYPLRQGSHLTAVCW
jgi:hypothetical protein